MAKRITRQIDTQTDFVFLLAKIIIILICLDLLKNGIVKIKLKSFTSITFLTNIFIFQPSKELCT